jgi:hypothetical protein
MFYNWMHQGNWTTSRGTGKFNSSFLKHQLIPHKFYLSWQKKYKTEYDGKKTAWQ